jgi:hypothetical protein
MASGKSLEKPKSYMVTLHYRKDGQPIHMVDKNGKPVNRVRMSKKERLRLRKENIRLLKASGNKINDDKS